MRVSFQLRTPPRLATAMQAESRPSGQGQVQRRGLYQKTGWQITRAVVLNVSPIKHWVSFPF